MIIYFPLYACVSGQFPHPRKRTWDIKTAKPPYIHSDKYKTVRVAATESRN